MVNETRVYTRYGILKGATYVVLGSLIWNVFGLGVTMLDDLMKHGYITDINAAPGSVEDFLLTMIFILLVMWFLGVVVALIPGVVGGALLGKSYHSLVVEGSFPQSMSWILGIIVGAFCGVAVMLLIKTWFDDPVIGVFEPERTILLIAAAAIATGFAGLAGWQMSRHDFGDVETGTEVS